MAKSSYQPGDTLVMRIRKGEDQIMEWAAKQSTLGESIRYLIEQEIQSHGISDISMSISSNRKILPTAVEIEPKLHELLYNAKGNVSSQETYEKLAQVFNLSEDDCKPLVRSGSEPQWNNNVRWARRYLSDKNYLVSVENGVWRLTDEGKKAFANK